MEAMRYGRQLPLLALVIVVMMVAAGCNSSGGAGDKAGGPGDPVTLRLATVNGDLKFTPQIQYFVDRIDELSEGNVRVEIAYEVGSFAANAETKVVDSVASGKFDMGFVGTHVFESMGVDSLRALTAPMLIDSYALEDAVVESEIPSRMMDGLDSIGVTGITILSGALRKPVAVKAPLLRPADWEGITFGVPKSEGQEQAIRQLATPMQVIGDSRDIALEEGTIDGFESSLLAYRLNGQAPAAPYVTSNVNLWPQTLAVVANPDALAELTDEQRAWLQEAADHAAGRSAALVDTDAFNLKAACEAGARFSEASETDLLAMQREFVPAYAILGEDSATSASIGQIQELKRSITPEPSLRVPTECAGEAPGELVVTKNAPAYLDGIYRYTITKEDVIEHDQGDPGDYPMTNTVTLDGGEFSVRGQGAQGVGGFSGTYSVKDDQIFFYVPRYEMTSTFSFTVDEAGNITLEALPPTDPGDAFEFSVHPWTRIR